MLQLDGSNFANTNGLFSGLSAGSGTYYVKDANGCVVNYGWTVTQNTAVSATATPTPNTVCGGAAGTITISASGGTGSGFQYSVCHLLWQFSVLTRIQIDNGATYQASNSFTSLHGGGYTFVVKDSNNCPYSNTVTVGSPDGMCYAKVRAFLTVIHSQRYRDCLRYFFEV